MPPLGGYLPSAPGVSTVRYPIPQRTFKYVATVQSVTDETFTSTLAVRRGKGTVEKFGINPMHYERRKTGGWRSSRKITSTRQEGRRGTGSSNPHPSSSESYANLTSSIMASLLHRSSRATNFGIVTR